MEMSQKEKSILTLFKELSEREEKILTMYFGLGGKPKTTLVEIGQKFDLTVEDVLQIKNDGIRNFINMIVSTESYPITIPDGFLESADSDFLDNFMSKFIGSN
jgi:ATP-dependent phosphoenolpyruvate carboxykinase